MAGVTFVDSDCYIGNIYSSLEYLPQWYQVVSLFGVLVLFSFREITVVRWLAASLHNSFGTEMVWSEKYRRRLEQMSFNERLCFTLYGIGLSLLALAAYRVFARDALRVGIQESDVTGGRKWWHVAFVCSLLLCEAIVILKEEVAHTLNDSKSLSHVILEELQEINKTEFDFQLAKSNPHFVIQLEILKRLLVSFIRRVGPGAILACFYRLLRDVPRKAHAALRWYLVTLMLSRSLVTLYLMYRNNDWEQQSGWILFVLTMTLLGLVNYIFGPSKRGGWTVATSVVASIHQAIQGIVKCTAIFFMTCLFALALVVSVHVVELLLIWLIFFLMMIWIPVIIDACSTDYIICIATAICFVAHQMEYLSIVGSLRLGGLLSLWWINLCFFYNFVTNACRSRYAGIVAVCFMFWGFWRTTRTLSETNDFVSFVESSVAALRQVVEETSPKNCSTLPKYNANGTLYVWALQSGFSVSAVLIMCIALLSHWEPQEVRSRLVGRSILIITPKVLFRKLTKTFIFVVSIFIFIITGIFFYRFLLHFAIFAPGFLTVGIAVSLSCAIFGGLMDVQESSYVGLMRLFGVMEPPAANDDDKDTDQSLFLVGVDASIMRR